MTGRVLGIFAHPDDESLVAGGTLAACAAAGFDVSVFCFTRGERGPIAGPELATRETLDVVREAELRAAAVELGVRTAECLAYPDGELEGLHSADISTDLARRIADVNPQVVITFGPEGWYWHPDHVAVHRLTTAALDELKGSGGLRPWVYHATCPKGHMGALVAAMTARGLPAELWGVDPVHFGVHASKITTVLDVRPFVHAKLRAVRSHRTQVYPANVFHVIPEDLAAEFLGREYFVRSRAGAAGTDCLAGVQREAVSLDAAVDR